MLSYDWTLPSHSAMEKSSIAELAKELKINPALVQALWRRGIKSFDEAKSYFTPDHNQLHNPFDLLDMHAAVNRIRKAITDEEEIWIFSDFDVDGVSSASILYIFLKRLGAHVNYYVPDRVLEGYGMSSTGVNLIAQAKGTLIIAVDIGITAHAEITLANGMAIDTIVVDHHEPSDTRPSALAVIDPKQKLCNYPSADLCGCGLTFKLIQALASVYASSDYWDLLDLVAIATAADIVPMQGENRVLTSLGIQRLNKQPRTGLKAVLSASGFGSKRIETGQIVFVIAPRFNAAGRMGAGARSVSLMVSEDKVQAALLASIIEQENAERKKVDEQVFKQALGRLSQEYTGQKIIVCAQEGWHAGVIGIVASRIVEEFYRPTFLISIDPKTGKGKGSVRSIPGFNIYNAMLPSSDLMEGWGGHAYAAGLTIDASNINQLRKELNEYAEQNMPEKLLTPLINIDSLLSLNNITQSFVKVLERCNPYGPGNPRPVFVTKAVEVVIARPVGNNHLKLTVKQDGKMMDVIGFGFGKMLAQVLKSKKLDIAYSIGINQYMGQEQIQLYLKDIHFEKGDCDAKK